MTLGFLGRCRLAGAAAIGIGAIAGITLLARLMRTDSSPSWISISATSDSSSSSMSFLTLRISIYAVFLASR